MWKALLFLEATEKSSVLIISSSQIVPPDVPSLGGLLNHCLKWFWLSLSSSPPNAALFLSLLDMRRKLMSIPPNVFKWVSYSNLIYIPFSCQSHLPKLCIAFLCDSTVFFQYVGGEERDGTLNLGHLRPG